MVFNLLVQRTLSHRFASLPINFMVFKYSQLELQILMFNSSFNIYLLSLYMQYNYVKVRNKIVY